MGVEDRFNAAFAASLALPEKQIQQNFRPVIGVHKWFARRPGTLFRNLLLAEFDGEPIEEQYWLAHEFEGVIADPFMGGGTPLIEANRLGFHVVGTDVNPMAYWIVRQALSEMDLAEFRREAEAVAQDIEAEIGDLFTTRCLKCGEVADAKYFIWVKTQKCPKCQRSNDLFPGYMLAENVRHPAFVLHCPSCKCLVEAPHLPSAERPVQCSECGATLRSGGPARRHQIACECGHVYRYPDPSSPPPHRMWAIEYHCNDCKPTHKGRFFKMPDAEDLKKVQRAEELLTELYDRLPIPTGEIPVGDESTRLHRWGYRYYKEMFTARQLVGLGLLLNRIMEVRSKPVRDGLLTVFSDSLRYQNLICRYDTMALKCQDIFSVHGFPVGLVQCENSVLGTTGVGSGSFRHFVEKFYRAKSYCAVPFETRGSGPRKKVVKIEGERIGAVFTDQLPKGPVRSAHLQAASADTLDLPPNYLDGVFTDPPYFDNVQYAELMDFCFVWLREALAREEPAFEKLTTRTDSELTGNATENRDLVHFTAGLSAIFTKYAAALKPGAPFLFTYHHNDLTAYAPLVVSILDAGMICTASLPAPAEMEASLHIAKTGSSILDSILVCRRADSDPRLPEGGPTELEAQLLKDCKAVAQGGVRVTRGDAFCLALGHVARLAIAEARGTWDPAVPVATKLDAAVGRLRIIALKVELTELPDRILVRLRTDLGEPQQGILDLALA